jgi:hypothetical protein
MVRPVCLDCMCQRLPVASLSLGVLDFLGGVQPRPSIAEDGITGQRPSCHPCMGIRRGGMESTYRMRFPGGILILLATICERKNVSRSGEMETVYLVGKRRKNIQQLAVSSQQERTSPFLLKADSQALIYWVLASSSSARSTAALGAVGITGSLGVGTAAASGCCGSDSVRSLKFR